MTKKFLSLLLICSCISSVHAMQNASIQDSQIDAKEWNQLKCAVFAKKNDFYKQQFDETYSVPSAAGVQELASALDREEGCQTSRWLLSQPRQLKISIAGDPVPHINPGICAQLICATLGYKYAEFKD